MILSIKMLLKMNFGDKNAEISSQMIFKPTYWKKRTCFGEISKSIQKFVCKTLSEES
jgi:hypothetical protein